VTQHTSVKINWRIAVAEYLQYSRIFRATARRTIKRWLISVTVGDYVSELDRVKPQWRKKWQMIRNSERLVSPEDQCRDVANAVANAADWSSIDVWVVWTDDAKIASVISRKEIKWRRLQWHRSDQFFYFGRCHRWELAHRRAADRLIRLYWSESSGSNCCANADNVTVLLMLRTLLKATVTIAIRLDSSTK